MVEGPDDEYRLEWNAPAVASLSVFVIELLPGTKAEYKRCEGVEARREEYDEYECHGVEGEFVYIRCVTYFIV